MIFKKLISTATITGFLAIAGTSANAATFDFAALANGDEGSSEGYTFSDGGTSVTTTAWSTAEFVKAWNGDAYSDTTDAYMDSGWAGLGACVIDPARAFLGSHADGTPTSSNSCGPDSSHDNVESGEVLVLDFNHAVNAGGFMFDDAGHNPLLSGALTLIVDGTFFTADFGDLSAYTGKQFIFTVDTFTDGDDLSWESGEGQFYISGVTVPEPGSLALLSLGLIGLGAARRKKA